MTSRPRRSGKSKGLAAIVGGVLLYLVAQVAGVDLLGGATGTTLAAGPSDEVDGAALDVRDDSSKILQLFSGMRSDIQVEAAGDVVRVLPDDIEGDQHQLFLCELSNGLTLKISHNIDVAPHIPLEIGDRVRFHGEYEWNEKGGVVHWTHRNLRGGRHEGGWIEHDGKRYE